MGRLYELLSLILVKCRYKIRFAIYKGALDRQDGLPSNEKLEAIASRLLSTNVLPAFKEHFPDAPLNKEDLIHWLKTRQKDLLGYLSELRNLGEELLCDVIRELHIQDVSLKTKYCIAKVRFLEAKNDLEMFEKQFPRYGRTREVAKWVYYLVVFLFVLGELPFNLVAMRLFGEAELLTIAVALVIGIVIAVTAHWIGGTSKQPIVTGIDKWMVGVSIMIVFAAIGGIAIIREVYLVNMGEKPNQAVTFAFVAFQLLFFFVASYLSHASHNFRLELQECKHTLDLKLNTFLTKRKVLLKAKQNELSSSVDYLNELYSAYVTENRLAGGTKGTDTEFLFIKIPDDLSTIDEDNPENLVDERAMEFLGTVESKVQPDAGGRDNDLQ